MTLTPTISDATSGLASKFVSVDGARSVALAASPVVVAKDGVHSLVFAATDVAGNRTATTVLLPGDY